MKKINVGIVGGAGYTGGELLRILVHHPQVNIVFVHSNSNAGNSLFQVHTDLLGDTELTFTDTLSDQIDVLFLCVGHGDAKKFLQTNAVAASVKIIDLSQDFRIQPGSIESGPNAGRSFVYGLPEYQRAAIQKAANISNPGCFATCLQLALLPMAANNKLKEEVHITATTGSTGAGQSLSSTSHFSWRNNNVSVYKAFEHQHLTEIKQTLSQLQRDLHAPLHFIPYRGDFTRGIFASLYIKTDVSLEAAKELYTAHYASHPFTRLSATPIDLKQVVNTNKCFLYLEKHGDQLLILSAIDNLLKGASGQAVQNMNLLFGLPETTGLQLKSIAF